MTAQSTHPIHRRYQAEDLIRLRRSSEHRRYVGSQRRGKIDPNPHQIDAVMFALRRISEGGCILADEVGLGKTIETGLVIAQLIAEGAERILIILPRSLIGQWQNELYDLFHLESVEVSNADVDIAAGGIFLAGREYAGGAGFDRLNGSPPFDLCIVDEAHEVFAGIHRRYDRYGVYDPASPHAQTAHRVRQVIGAAPVLLLTATPIQNSLAELWGLVQYVEPTGTLFGDKPTFMDLFCEGSDSRRAAPEQSDELRRRLSVVVQRTLRRQAQEFLERPFVGRHAQLFEYSMSQQEHALYNDITEYLLRPTIAAFLGSSRQLLLIGFHRRMASSIAALAQSLAGVAKRLRAMLDDGEEVETMEAAFVEDLEDEELAELAGSQEDNAAKPAYTFMEKELAEVESFIQRAQSLPTDSKAASLVKAVKLIMNRTGARHKVVIFTESLVTQEYLRQLLISSADLSDGEITLFRGSNDSARARQALAQWQNDVLPNIADHLKPSADVAMRLALVQEFENTSKVFISTEAGAKGLNLQFCDTIVNYDLPWNPQRIEQRIGRCHRYGQERDVTVINFLAKDNEAQRLTLEILSSKLDLFGDVLDMSDEVLQSTRSDGSQELATALGPEFESQLNQIWDRARSISEVEEELRKLRDSMEASRQNLEEIRERTVGLIESRLDESVRDVFKNIRDALPRDLAEYDLDLEKVVCSYLDATGIENEIIESETSRLLKVLPSSKLPAAVSKGVSVALGSAKAFDEVESMHSAHPLIDAAVSEARRNCTGSYRVSFHLTDAASEPIKSHRGSRGRLALTRISHRGFEREDRLLVTAVFENAEVLQPAAAAHELLHLNCKDISSFEQPLGVSADDLDEVVEEELFLDKSHVSKHEQQRFEAAMDQLDQHMEDRILILRRAQVGRMQHLNDAEKRRDGALGSDARSKAETLVNKLTEEVEDLEQQLDNLTGREDEAFRRWKQHAHDRRYKEPHSKRLLEVEFIIE